MQIHSNLAYDKLVRYLNELEMKEMILKSPLRMTDKGRDFLQVYDRTRNESKVQNQLLVITSLLGTLQMLCS